MSSNKNRDKRADVNPSARRDHPGEPHGEPAPGPPKDPEVRAYQKEPLDPRDQGGITE